jgi:D-alanine-D-alanine ligase
MFGGRSGEHEVSLASAASVMKALDPAKYEVVPIGIAKDGRWLAGSPAQKMLPEVLRQGQGVMLSADPNVGALVPVPNSANAGAGHASMSNLKVDVVFPVLHGTYGEDGTVQGLLELANVAFVGSGVVGSAVGMDKDMQKRLFQQAGIPVGDFMAFPRSQWEQNPKLIMKALLKKFRFPVFVKPATLGSSVGMTKAHDRAELTDALNLASEFAQKIVVEKTIKGREIEVAVLGNDDPKASIPGEIIPHREYYDYAAKYLEEGTRLLIPAKLNKAQIRRFQDYAVRAFRCLELRGMARVDFFLERPSGKIYLNEVNTIPGFTSISMYPKLWEASGLPYPKLIDSLIELALSEHSEKQRTKYSIELPEGSGGALGA